jgi:glycine C-acetyltransferase
MIPPVLSQKIDSTKNSRKIPPVIQSAQGPSLIVEGKKLLNFCSSHYLGFANDSQVKDAVKKAVSQYGIGTGYRTLAGTNILHVELENKLAAFKGAEAAILLSGGYMANCAAIQTIIGKWTSYF